MGKYHHADICYSGTSGFRMSWPYVAGFFDGEGCIFMNHISGRLTGHYKVTITQSERPVLQGVAAFLAQNGIDSRIYGRQKMTGQRRQLINLIIQRKENVVKFLRFVIPYLWVKRVQAQDALRIMSMWEGLRSNPEFRREHSRKMVESRKVSTSWLASVEHKRERTSNRLMTIASLRASGMSYKEIAKTIGSTEESIYHLTSRHKERFSGFLLGVKKNEEVV